MEMHVSLTTNSNSHIQSQGVKEQIEDLDEVVSPCNEWQYVKAVTPSKLYNIFVFCTLCHFVSSCVKKKK
jgi:hypothetical protein